MPTLRSSVAPLLVAIALGGCGTTETVPVARTAAAGRWEAARLVADAGEIPLSDCGTRDPACRRADERYHPALAMNALGEAAVVWGQDDGGYRLWSSRYSHATGFRPPELVSRDAGSYGHRVVMDDQGRAVALWQWYVPSYDRVTLSSRQGLALSRFAPGPGWGPPERIGGVVDTHQDLAVGGARAVMLFQKVCGPYYDPGCGPGNDLYASRFETGGGTLAGELVKADERFPCGKISNQARVAAAPGGAGMAVWIEYGKTTVYGCPEDFLELWSSRFAAGGGWAAPQRLARATGLGRLDHAQVAVDAGDGLLVYEQGPRYDQPSVWARRVTAAGSWLEPENVSPSGQVPVLAANRRGDAFVLWRERVGDRFRLAGRWFSKRAGAWGPTRVLQPDVERGYVDVGAAVDEAGHATVAWRSTSQSAQTCDIWASRYSADEGWGVPACLQAAGTAESTSAPAVGTDASGQSLVAWSESDGTRARIWANRYVLDAR